MQYIGEIAALATAFCWALSIVYFKRLGGSFSPLALNLWKGLISIVGLTLIVAFSEVSIPALTPILWLLLSGVIGIGIGDTAFFAGLNRLGERNALLVAETLAPIFTALLAIVWISEWLTPLQWLAIGVILFGVDIVLRCKNASDSQVKPSFSGLSFAAIAALCQAAGAVIGRDVLTTTDIDPITASLIRLVGGLSIIVIVLVVTRRTWLPTQPSGAKTWWLLFIATFTGTFIAMTLQMFAFSKAQAAIVQSLFAGSIIFSLIIARLQGQFISNKAVIGSLIAITGIALIFVL